MKTEVVHNGFYFFRQGRRFFFGPAEEGVEVVHPHVLKQLRRLARPKRPRIVRRYRTPGEIARYEVAKRRKANAPGAAQKAGIIGNLKKRFGDMFRRRGQ